MSEAKDRPRSPERKPVRGRAFGALTALYFLAAALPGVTLPSKAAADSNDFSDYSTGEIYNVDPKAEAKRKEQQLELRKGLGERPKELRAKMQGLLSLGPKCDEKVDRGILQTMPGAQDMYQKLLDLFANYNGYMRSLDDHYADLGQPINPTPPAVSADGYYSSDYGSAYGLGYDGSDDGKVPSLDDVLRNMHNLESEIENGIRDVLQYPDADKLIKLLLQDASCAIS